MILAATLFGKRHEFATVKEVLAKANEDRSGDHLAGVAVQRLLAVDIAGKLGDAGLQVGDGREGAGVGLVQGLSLGPQARQDRGGDLFLLARVRQGSLGRLAPGRCFLGRGLGGARIADGRGQRLGCGQARRLGLGPAAVKQRPLGQAQRRGQRGRILGLGDQHAQDQLAADDHLLHVQQAHRVLGEHSEHRRRHARLVRACHGHKQSRLRRVHRAALLVLLRSSFTITG